MPSVSRPSHNDFIENYDALLHLPIVQNLMKKNKELRRKVKTLETLLYKFPELFADKATKSIKTDSTVEPMLCDTLADDDDVVFVPQLKEDVESDEESEVIDLTGHDEEVLDAQPNVFIKIEPESAVKAVEEETQSSDQADEEEHEEEEEAQSSEQADEVEEEEAEKPAGDDEEVFEITIKGKSYYTNNETNGKIYSILEDEDVGPVVGEFVGGKAQFTKQFNKK